MACLDEVQNWGCVHNHDNYPHCCGEKCYWLSVEPYMSGYCGYYRRVLGHLNGNKRWIHHRHWKCIKQFGNANERKCSDE